MFDTILNLLDRRPWIKALLGVLAVALALFAIAYVFLWVAAHWKQVVAMIALLLLLVFGGWSLATRPSGGEVRTNDGVIIVLILLTAFSWYWLHHEDQKREKEKQRIDQDRHTTFGDR